MPVVDHPVHKHGVRAADTHRYGCHNRPAAFRRATRVQDGWWSDGVEMVAKAVLVPYRMSHECRYDRSLTDTRCLGCVHAGSGERYVAEQEQAIRS